jgi:small subunit ribosomal protein S4
MNKLRPRNKICFQNNKNIHANLKIHNLNKKKWNILKKNIFWKNKKKKQLLNKLNFLKKLEKNYNRTYNYKIYIDKYLKENKIRRPQKKKLYKERLLAKQQFKFFYGCIPEYQLKNLFSYLKLKNNRNVLQKFIILLESRLDMIIFRLRIVKTIFEAKQIINHGKIKINNKIIFSSNLLLKKGDIITLNNFKIKFFFRLILRKKQVLIEKTGLTFLGRPKKPYWRTFFYFKKKKRKNKVNYLQFNYKYNVGIFLRSPLFNEIKYPFAINLNLVDQYFNNY